jgi:hypothetical protein
MVLSVLFKILYSDYEIKMCKIGMTCSILSYITCLEYFSKKIRSKVKFKGF